MSTIKCVCLSPADLEGVYLSHDSKTVSVSHLSTILLLLFGLCVILRIAADTVAYKLDGVYVSKSTLLLSAHTLMTLDMCLV